jgi:hypothetical protein
LEEEFAKPTLDGPQEPAEKEQARVEIRDVLLSAEGIPEYYSNIMACRSARYDATLVFGVDNQEKGISPVVKIRMSLEHLAAMIGPISSVIESFEKQVGPVPGNAHHAISGEKASATKKRSTPQKREK